MNKGELKIFLNSDDFAARIVKLTRHTVRDVFKNIIAVTAPLLILIVGLIVFIFNDQNNSLDSLSRNVHSLGISVAKLDKSIEFFDKTIDNINNLMINKK